MTSIKLKFRAHTDKEGALYFQIIHERTVKQIRTGLCIFELEWDRQKGRILKTSPISSERDEILHTIRNKIDWEQRKISQSLTYLENSGIPFTAADIIRRYKETLPGETSVFQYIRQQSDRLRKLGRTRTSETYLQALRSFMRFRNNTDLYFDMLNADVIEQYETYMRAKCLSRNTTSFYMRILRCIYNRAAEAGLAPQADLFKRVYTGVDKTSKRAIAIKEIKQLKELDLSGQPDLQYARDIFMFSFYMRGMSFIDLAYLRKCDLSDGYVTYIRKKTGQLLTIRWEKQMQEIIDRYPHNPTQYLLPIIMKNDGTERRQYLNRIMLVNRRLKQVARLARIPIPLSMYVARHSWASIAQSKNVPLSVIREGMGHDKEETTRIYLASIQTSQIDAANSRILKDL